MISHRLFLAYLTTLAALGGLLFGFETGIIAGALTFINLEFSPTISQQEWIVSMAVLGALFGALSSGYLADLYGRRQMLLIAAYGFIAGTLVASLATSVMMLIVGRLILGLSIGIASFTAPLFISELAPAKKRGKLVLLNGIMITGGQAIAFLISYNLAEYQAWRLMIGVGLLPSILLLVGMWFAPGSPRWLVLKNAKQQAITLLKKIRESDAVVNQEIKDIEENIQLEKKRSLKDLLTKQIRPVLVIGLGLGLLQQFVGINTVMYYGPTIFQEVGFPSTKAQILGTFGMGLVNFVMTIFILLTVDRWGRRKPLIVGTAIAAISLFSLGILIRSDFENNPMLTYLAVVCLITYIAGYAISLGSLFWLLISEIFPLRIRGLAMSFVTAVQWAGNFIVTWTFLTMLNLIGGSHLFWIYGIMALIAMLFCYFYVPETKNVPLERIEKNLLLGKRSRWLGAKS